MGQQTSKEHDRLNELRELCWKNHRLRLSLGLSDRAVYRAAWLHYEELWKEQDAIWAVLRESCPVQPAEGAQHSCVGFVCGCRCLGSMPLGACSALGWSWLRGVVRAP